MERAIAFSLGYSNRTNTTSTTDQSYLQYCLDSANRVYHLGATPPSGPAPATVLTDQLDASGTWSGRETTFDDAGNPVLVRWHRSDGSHGVESFNPVDQSRSGVIFKPDGSSTRYTDDGQGNVVATDYDPTGAPMTVAPPRVNPTTNTAYQSAVIDIPPGDPLTLDLDGDGLETVGINASSPILFDHDADGVKTATGWVKADDAFLVFDRNGNGTIDTGRELFGDSTALYAGGLAADGFAALAQEDTNQDGLVSAADANWNSLRLWRDLNQDGVSQANELLTLASQGITALNPCLTRQEKPSSESIACVPEKYQVALQACNF